MTRHALFSLCLLGVAAFLAASDVPQRKSITLPADNAMCKLKRGPGMEQTTHYCSICHSTDYIVRQPRLDAAHWQGEVKKMITVFGAPISPEDAKAIADYLTSAYGTQSPKTEEAGK